METKEIASGLVALCREGKFDEAMAAYYSEGIVSVEGDGSEVVGRAACEAKGAEWESEHEVHGIEVEGPFVGVGQFVVRFKLDVTIKATGLRIVADEVGIYTVEAGKIVREVFLFTGM
jgi:SnoaL-like domain